MENVDPRELEKFEAIASRWWDPEGDFKPLHAINPLRLKFIDDRSALSGQRVVDIGCGGGLLTESMAQKGAIVTGIDMSTGPLGVARLHAKETGLDVEYLHSTAEALAVQRPQQFDVVTCLELLEHVPDPAAVVRAAADLVKPGGHVYFSTINRTPKAWLFAVVGAEYLLGLLPKGTHQYEKFIRPSELVSWCRSSALIAAELTGLHYNPLTERYHIGPGVDVNYLAHCTHAVTN